MGCPNCDSENYHAVNVVDARDEERVFLWSVGFCTDCYAIQLDEPED